MNTVLIVVILVLLVGFGVWYFTDGFTAWGTPEQQDEAEFNLNVEVPTGENNNGSE